MTEQAIHSDVRVLGYQGDNLKHVSRTLHGLIIALGKPGVWHWIGIAVVLALVVLVFILPCGLEMYEDIRDYLVMEYPRYNSVKSAFRSAELVIVRRVINVTSDWRFMLTYVRINITVTIKGPKCGVITIIQHGCKTP